MPHDRGILALNFLLLVILLCFHAPGPAVIRVVLLAPKSWTLYFSWGCMTVIYSELFPESCFFCPCWAMSFSQKGKLWGCILLVFSFPKYFSDGELEIKRYKKKKIIHLAFGRVKTKGVNQLTACENSPCLEAWVSASGLVLLVKKRANWKTVWSEISLLVCKWFLIAKVSWIWKSHMWQKNINLAYVVLHWYAKVFFQSCFVVLFYIV